MNEQVIYEPVNAEWAKRATEAAELRDYQEAINYINKKIRKAASCGEWEITLIDFEDFDKPVDTKIIDIYKKMGFNITELVDNKLGTYFYLGELVIQKKWMISWR